MMVVRQKVAEIFRLRPRVCRVKGASAPRRCGNRARAGAARRVQSLAGARPATSVVARGRNPADLPFPSNLNIVIYGVHGPSAMVPRDLYLHDVDFEALALQFSEFKQV